MAKVGGGVNPMHLSNDGHPFQKKFGNHKAQGSHSAAHANGAAGSVGPNQSASASMTKRRPLNGSGKA